MDVSVVCPLATNLALCLKFSPILTSNIIWHLICRYPGGICSTSFSKTLKAGLPFLISLHIASHNKVSPFSWSRRLASSTDLGIQIPNLWVLSQYFHFTFDMIRFLFFNRILSKVQKSFCSCTHVKSCQKYTLYINLHILLNILS